MRKNYWKRITALAATVALAVGALAGCGSQSASSSSKSTSEASADASSSDKNKATTLNVAYQAGYIQIEDMKEKKTLETALKDKGYDVKVTYTQFESGPPENEAFASDQQDVGFMGNVPALSGIASGQKRSLVGIAINGPKLEAVVVPKDSPIKTVKDLKGKKIGLVVGSIAQNLVYNLFKANGLDFNDAQYVNLSPGEQESALSSGQVDAVATWEPTITNIVNDGTGRVLANGENGILLAENPIVARTEYVEANPDIIETFLQVYKKTTDEELKDKDGYIDKYYEAMGIDKDSLAAMVNASNYPVKITDEDIKDLQGTADFLKDTGLINQDLKVSDYVISDWDLD